MKRKPTDAEYRMFHALKYHRIPFMPQVVIGRYIVDFLLTDRNLILEVDGASHQNKRRYDQQRDAFLSALGWVILRVPNEEATIEWVRDSLLVLPKTPQEEIVRRLSYARAVERDRIEQTKKRLSKKQIVDMLQSNVVSL